MNCIKRGRKHLRKNNMTYVSHFDFAFRHGVRCILAGVLLIVHSIVPCIFRRVGSRLVSRLAQDFKEHRSKK
jgi:hypothetical protein